MRIYVMYSATFNLEGGEKRGIQRQGGTQQRLENIVERLQ
jgi:hypothetical protein